MDKAKFSFLLIVSVILLSVLTSNLYSNEPRTTGDNDLAAKMIRFGIEAQERKKYPEAKEYFRKAIVAHPSSQEAWKYYDMSIIFALAERVKKQDNLIQPVVQSVDMESATQDSEVVALAPSAEKAAPAADKKEADEVEFKIVDDEDGCY